MPQDFPSIRCVVKEYRQRKGLSQEELAEQVGIRRQAIYDIESGRYLPNTEIALRLARVFGCAVENLFVEEPTTPKENVRLLDTPSRPAARLAVARIRGELIGIDQQKAESMPFSLSSPDAVWKGPGKPLEILRPHGEIEKNVLVLGCDPALSILQEQIARAAPNIRVHSVFASSRKALQNLAEGSAHIAGTHFHNSGAAEANLKAVKTALPGVKCSVIGFSVLEEGIMAASGNPLGISGVESLIDKRIRFVNREKGAALRNLLEKKLQDKKLPATAISGYSTEVSSHCEGAFHILCGTADAALGLRIIAESFGLCFIPLAVTRCDLVIPHDLQQHPGVAVLLDVLQSSELKTSLQTLPGYDATATGKIISD